MVKYFYGSDAYGARLALDEEAGQKGRRIRLIGREELAAKPARVWLEESAGGLFGGETAVVQGASFLPKGLQDDLLEAIKSIPGADYVVWDAGEPDRRSRVWRELGKEGRAFPFLDNRKLTDWLGDEAAKQGGAIGSQAAKSLVERLGRDRWRLKSELERLLLMGDEVTVEIVRREVAASEGGEIFTVLAAVTRGDSDMAIGGTLALLEEGNSEFYIFSMLAYQYRTLLTIRLGLDEGWRQMDITRKTGMKSFAVEKNMGYAKKFPSSYWRDGLARILASDFSIKQGRIDARTALLMLILSLSRKR